MFPRLSQGTRVYNQVNRIKIDNDTQSTRITYLLIVAYAFNGESLLYRAIENSILIIVLYVNFDIANVSRSSLTSCRVFAEEI